MRIASAGHAVFAAFLIGIGIQGLATGEFTTVGSQDPRGCRRVSSSRSSELCALLSLASGIGLLVWVPILAAGSTNAFEWMQFATTLALTAAGGGFLQCMPWL